MKVIELLEKLEIGGVEYIDIDKEDGDVLCSVECANRWHEFLVEKVLDSEVIKFSIGDCGLDIYVKNEESSECESCNEDENGSSFLERIREIVKTKNNERLFLGFDTKKTHIGKYNINTDELLCLYSLHDKDCEEELIDAIKAIYSIDDYSNPGEHVRHEIIRLQANFAIDKSDNMEDK